ncbi:MAG: hypothetical protein HGN29_14700 [Asgard group archaeon]|nr:hypothetical protein [Asgard group archaeon]
MEKRKSAWLVLLIFLTIFFFSSKSSVISAKIQNIESLKLLAHEPIEIICDQNLTDYNFPGSGTKLDPFIISGLEINTTNSNQNNIMIKYTTKSFIIENCVLSKPSIFRYPNLLSSRLSIYIRDCKNDTVIIRNNLCEGISIYNTSFSVIEKNEVKNSIDNGILVRHSLYTFVRNNYVYDNGIGIHIENSYHCFTERNRVVNNSGYLELVSGIDDLYVPSGLLFQGKCSKSIIQGNYFENNRNTISIWGGINYTISSNIVKDSKDSSIYISRVTDSLIFNNSVQSGYRGIYLGSTFSSVINYNNISNNKEYGLLIAAKCENNIIYYNRFIDNGIRLIEKGEIESQASDWGINNTFYDKENHRGNYWSDLKKIPYLVDGKAKSVDLYPINFIIDKTYLITDPILAILPLIVVLIYFLKLKYKRGFLKSQNYPQ